ncbi:sugar phosphate isomerase/epimerase family protein [Paenibacillus sp. GCM10023248]|uniref:sugar phosphate isomerase/epimerase family protein n=1 Tax=unclassified Paenibacillus TaxID=185978 RepID=UPI002378ADF1|nr:mannonate dehydratase [Paenibacillus sp. MAHUQ-63]MDD9268162.1 mannonate dehydratase [Paenibacillus sp. MAHUQ-63]
MMKVSIQVPTCDLSDSDLRQMCQLGVDCIDFTRGSSFPGVSELGYPDLDQLLKLKRRIRSFGMDINRVTLPDMTSSFMRAEPGTEIQLENVSNAIRAFGEAGITLVRQRFAGDVFPYMSEDYTAVHRGGALVRGESTKRSLEQQPPTVEQLNEWWKRFDLVFGTLVPLAEDYNVNLAVHPSDTPHHNTTFGGLGLNRVIDAFPSKNVGLVYCVGTRGEAGGTPLVLDEIYQYGRKNRIFLVHFRNIRGSLATAGAFEEALLDDGHMNMAKILLALHKVGYNGCINPDHITSLEMDRAPHNPSPSGMGWVGWAYSVGYVKALLAALVEFHGGRD